MKRPVIISFIFAFYFTTLLVGQEKVLQGKITTFDSIPLIGASIQVKSSKEIVLSDTLGIFSVSCLQKDKLKIEANGFLRQNVKIAKENRYIFVNLKLKSDPENRDIAIGYGHVKDKDRLYSISNLNKNDMNFSQFSNIYEIIAGRFPGVQIRNGEIIIRGINSINSSNAALIVVDGVIVDYSLLSSLPTADIASINILKGAGAAIYGSRGANGVVMIETKKK
jgi:TonB-dependent SusC/RagA subfamily outer membrane receptor